MSKHSLLKSMVLLLIGLITASAVFIKKDKFKAIAMTQNESDKTTLVVTATPNPNEPEALQSYVQGVTPLLIGLGGEVVKRSKLTDTYFGEKPGAILLIMDFPSKKALKEFFDSETYQAFIPDREKAFSDINILFADNME